MGFANQLNFFFLQGNCSECQGGNGGSAEKKSSITTDVSHYTGIAIKTEVLQLTVAELCFDLLCLNLPLTYDLSFLTEPIGDSSDIMSVCVYFKGG